VCLVRGPGAALGPALAGRQSRGVIWGGRRVHAGKKVPPFPGKPSLAAEPGRSSDKTPKKGVPPASPAGRPPPRERGPD